MGCLPQSLFTQYLNQSLLLNTELTNLSRLVDQWVVGGSSYICLPNTEVTDVYHHDRCFTCILRSTLGSFCLGAMHLINKSVSPDPESLNSPPFLPLYIRSLELSFNSLSISLIYLNNIYVKNPGLDYFTLIFVICFY